MEQQQLSLIHHASVDKLPSSHLRETNTTYPFQVLLVSLEKMYHPVTKGL